MKIIVRQIGESYPLIHLVVEFLGKVSQYVIPLQTAIQMDLCINCIQEQLIDDEPYIKDDVEYELDHGKLREYILADILSDFKFTQKQIDNLYEIQGKKQR